MHKGACKLDVLLKARRDTLARRVLEQLVQIMDYTLSDELDLTATLSARLDGHLHHRPDPVSALRIVGVPYAGLDGIIGLQDKIQALQACHLAHEEVEQIIPVTA